MRTTDNLFVGPIANFGGGGLREFSGCWRGALLKAVPATNIKKGCGYRGMKQGVKGM